MPILIGDEFSSYAEKCKSKGVKICLVKFDLKILRWLASCPLNFSPQQVQLKGDGIKGHHSYHIGYCPTLYLNLKSFGVSAPTVLQHTIEIK